jgi:uncharacterized protein
MEKLHFLHLSWDDVQGLTEKVASKINDSGFDPDLIVAVSRGGFDPARIICDQLGKRRLASVQVESYDGMNRSREPEVVLPINANVKGLKVLVVDDVSDSGASLLKAKQHITEKGAVQVRVVTLHIKPWSKFIPDYYAESTDSWVVYPWELKESLCEVAKNIRLYEKDRSVLVKKLIGFGFTQNDIEKYLL